MTAKGALTRARILETATDLLIAGGAARFSLDEVLRRTRTSKSQLFYHFPGGKDELCRAATEHQVQRMVQRASWREGGLSDIPQWRAWFGQLVELHRQQSRDDACEVAALAGRVLDTDGDLRGLVGHAFVAWHGFIEASLVAMRDAGHLRPETPVAALASLILAALEGGAVLDKATATSEYLPQALEQALALLHSYGPTLDIAA